jgi:hypothetical protein
MVNKDPIEHDRQRSTEPNGDAQRQRIDTAVDSGDIIILPALHMALK